MVADTGKILYSAAADENNRVFLQIMSFTGNICGHFDAIRQAYACYLPKRGIRFLGGRCIDPRTDTALLWRLP